MLADWLPGRTLDPSTRKKLLLADGIRSGSGAALRSFALLRGHLTRVAGYGPGDFGEASFRLSHHPDGPRPVPYEAEDTLQPLAASAAAFAATVEWYAARLPADTEFHLLGFSLGGVVWFEAARLLVARDRDRWRGRLASLTTLASPLNGVELDPVDAVAAALVGPAGPALAELAERAADPRTPLLLLAQRAELERWGLRIQTLAAADDVVVRPHEAIIGEGAEALLPSVGGGLGHGGVIDTYAFWQRVLALVGPQEPARLSPALLGGPPASGAGASERELIDRQLQALKERLARHQPHDPAET